MTDIKPIVLTTPRFRLRTIDSGDSSHDFRAWTQDADLMAPMNLPVRSLTDKQVKSYFGSFDNIDRFFFLVEELETGAAIGFWTIEVNRIHRTATWNIAVSQQNWGEDVAVETGMPLLDYLFGQCGIEKMVTLTLTSNAKVIHRMEMGSWKLEGRFVKELSSPDGSQRLDQFRFALLATDWPAARGRLIKLWSRAASDG
jgi:RimJ/RimL family protein N-acetyltransferase